MAAIATSLASAYRLRKTATALRLVASPDLLCINMMCQFLGEPCVCRLAQSLSRMEALVELDISKNNLSKLPDAVFECAGLHILNLSHNRFPSLSPKVSGLTQLHTLNLEQNASLRELPLQALAALPHLCTVNIRGNTTLLENQALTQELSSLLQRSGGELLM